MVIEFISSLAPLSALNMLRYSSASIFTIPCFEYGSMKYVALV
jgi:hypothetical protein